MEFEDGAILIIGVVVELFRFIVRFPPILAFKPTPNPPAVTAAPVIIEEELVVLVPESIPVNVRLPFTAAF